MQKKNLMSIIITYRQKYKPLLLIWYKNMKRNTILASLGALIIIGWGIYASGIANSPLQHLKASEGKNQLTANDRNTLVTEVENLKRNLGGNNTVINPIPDGAVMAFDAQQCPEGWSVYEKAKWRFIMGAEYQNQLWSQGGQRNITLTIGQLPPHHFEININNYKGGDNANHRDFVKSREQGGGKFKTNTIGNWDPIDITNPHVKLLYCIKGWNGWRSLASTAPTPTSTPTPTPIDWICKDPGEIDLNRYIQGYRAKCSQGNTKDARKTTKGVGVKRSRKCEWENGWRTANCSVCRNEKEPKPREFSCNNIFINSGPTTE